MRTMPRCMRQQPSQGCGKANCSGFNGAISTSSMRLVVRRNLTLGQIGTPKNGQQRIVPLIPQLAERLKEFKRKKLNPPISDGVLRPPDVAVKRYRAALRAGQAAADCRSMACATRSAATRLLSPLLFKCATGWATVICVPPAAIYMPRASTAMQICWREDSGDAAG